MQANSSVADLMPALYSTQSTRIFIRGSVSAPPSDRACLRVRPKRKVCFGSKPDDFAIAHTAPRFGFLLGSQSSPNPPLAFGSRPPYQGAKAGFLNADIATPARISAMPTKWNHAGYS